MEDLCNEVIQRLEDSRMNDCVVIDIELNGTSISIYDNSSFTHVVSLSMIPSHLSGSFNVIFKENEFTSPIEILQSIADSIYEDVRNSAMREGLWNAFIETKVKAQVSQRQPLLETSFRHDMRETGDKILLTLQRIKVLAENNVKPNVIS